ncbi:hypothetical protein A0H81_12672 [Grifola frondosa]|uniref:Sugar phosphate transporter domain-containing protein n=1 Tax=Grifola frondosa TaxID=5627 RepID=A0A1C7LT74_GRIFR|nr:hypothetical protein A0H81_12672 [Grifola frondosa]
MGRGEGVWCRAREAGGPVGRAAVYNFGSGKKVSRSSRKQDRGISLDTGVTVKDQFLKWEDGAPETKVLAHTPGYTVLDNVILCNGTFVLVTDIPSSIPPLGSIASSAIDFQQPPRPQDWEVLGREEASTKLGTYGGRIFGTSWIALGSAESQDPYTLMSLFRTHSSLSVPSSSSFTTPSGLHIIRPPDNNAELGKPIPAPLRFMFPHVPTFSSPRVPPPSGDEKEHPPPRIRSYNGIHPFLPKAVLPTLGIWYSEDWQDLAQMEVPWLLERVVVADRGAAERGRSQWAPSGGAAGDMKKRAAGDEGEPAWAAPFIGLKAADDWWAPVHASLARYLHIEEREADAAQASRSLWGKKTKKAAAAKPVVSYVSMQDEPAGAGPRLRDEDHEGLVRGLDALLKEGVLKEVHVLKGNGSVTGTEWEDRMRAISRSSVSTDQINWIVLGPYGFHLADSIFMSKPAVAQSDSAASSQQENAQRVPPLLMEFFPPGTFVRDQEFAVRSIGMQYIAWWNDRKFFGDVLPPVTPPHGAAALEQRVGISTNLELAMSMQDDVHILKSAPRRRARRRDGTKDLSYQTTFVACTGKMGRWEAEMNHRAADYVRRPPRSNARGPQREGILRCSSFPVSAVSPRPANKPKLSAAAIIPIWIVLSSSVIIFNNYLYNSLEFRFPVFLVTWHLTFAAIGTRVLQRTTHLLDGVKDVHMSKEMFLRSILPIGLLFSASLILSNTAYLYLSVAYIQMLKVCANLSEMREIKLNSRKAFTPVAILLISWTFRIKDPNKKLAMIVFMISAGVALASRGELRFNLVGFLTQAAAVAFEASRLVMIEILLHGLKMDPLVSLHYYAPVCAVINLAVIPLTEGLAPFYEIMRVGPLILLCNAIIAFLLNVAAVFLVGAGSGLVLTLAGVFKDIMLITGSVLVFGALITPLQIIGYTIALGGLILYKTSGSK